MRESKLYNKFDDVIARYRESGRSALTEAEHDWIRVANYHYQVGNGGICQYIYNPWDEATEFEDTMAALQRIGAPFAAVVVRDISLLFPGGAPFDTEERYDMLLSWPEGSHELQVLDASEEKAASHFHELGRLFDAFLLRNDFCDPEDLV